MAAHHLRDLVYQASAGGARVIAFDVLFAEPAAGDTALAEAIIHARTETDARTARRDAMSARSNEADATR